ncbi:MAG: porin family protein [Acidobacteriia bacterium]|nr:porin family protein [Terriglobia bacterium]
MRKLLCVLGLVCLASVGAAAQDVPRVDLFGGYSYVHTGPGVSASAFNANGGVGSVALNLTSWAGLVGEVGGIHATTIGNTSVSATALTFLAGPKIAFFQRSSLSPFVQALAGVVRTDPGFNQTPNTHYTFAFSPGAGLDWNATHHFGIRLGQVDYLLTRIPTSTNQVNWNNFRYSAGVVFRF